MILILEFKQDPEMMGKDVGNREEFNAWEDILEFIESHNCHAQPFINRQDAKKLCSSSCISFKTYTVYITH